MSDARTPEQIRADIENTREDLADTAAALAQKADVKGRARDRVDEIKSDIKSTIKDKTPDIDTSEGPAATVSGAATSAGTAVRSNPVPAAAAAAAVLGFALGYLWATRGADD